MSEVNTKRPWWKLAKSWDEDFHPGNLLCWAARQGSAKSGHCFAKTKFNFEDLSND